MNKLTFKISDKKTNNLTALIKGISSFQCRIYLDIENNFITVENVSDYNIDPIIDMINECFALSGVEIDNLSDVSSEPVEMERETNETANIPKETTTLGPQSADDLIIKKVDFENENIEKVINKLLRTSYWAIYNHEDREKEVVNYIWTTIREMSMRYSTSNIIDFSFGDIVDCYFGTHLPKEVIGSHVYGVVVDISSENMVFIVPITKVTSQLSSSSYLTFTTPKDIEYNGFDYPGGSVLIDKGRYIRPERLQTVVGKASPEFMSRILIQLASTFDFRSKLANRKTPSVLTGEQTNCNDTINNSEDSSIMRGLFESVLINILKPTLSKLVRGGCVRSNAQIFLNDINMPNDDKIIEEAFVVACTTERITYASIIMGIHDKFPEIDTCIIRNTLKDVFKEWLKTREDLKEYPRINITSMLKLFAQYAK